MWLFLAFLAVPLIEIGLFIQVGGAIGLLPTLGIVILTAVVGTLLVRTQGAMALGNLRRSFSELSNPAEPLAHGAMILIAGALLLTPGFFTDAVGFALLMPPVRVAVFNYLRQRITMHKFEMGEAHPSDPRHSPQADSPAGGDVIEGEFDEIDPTKKPTHRPSGWTKH
ncbi:FxsA family protein [Cognatishimia sp. SS12]|uniref:FxsA family protein n=1 Tax=Cognatishimia sp. SS12 TaxID=2979465 RepID=UPI00232BD3E4|nr:FxsA family protein [Cognatishimia sp. SS12]MDC0737747.1 FxsA family protein [Cognatishimia sp. SS12]